MKNFALLLIAGSFAVCYSQRYPALSHRTGLNPLVEARSDAYWIKASVETSTVDRLSHAPNRTSVLERGDSRVKEIALTFDDGPHPIYTEKLLALLRQERVPATFFVVGKMAERYPNLVREEVVDGDLVGNHTFSHVTLTRLPDSEIRTEYRACNDVLLQITGQVPRYCRPPGGDTDPRVVAAARSLGLTTVLWTDDPGDFASPGDAKIEDRVLAKIGNGGIVLLHDGIQQTLDVLPRIVKYARERGYRFVTVAGLK